MRPGKSDPLTLVPSIAVGKLYRSPMPRGRYDRSDLVLSAWTDAEIDVVVSLTPVSEFEEKTGLNQIPELNNRGFEVIQFPIADRGVSASSAMNELVWTIIGHLTQGRNVTVHCSAGIGRTGTVIACVIGLLNSLTANETCSILNGLTPSIGPENQIQVEFVESFLNGL